MLTIPPDPAGNPHPLDELTELVPGALLRYRVHRDDRAELLYISRYAMDIWGVTAQAALADESLLWATGCRDDQIAVRESFLQAVRQRRIWWHEWRIKDAQGRLKWLRGTAKPVEQEDGSVLCTAFIMDVSESLRARALESAGDERPRQIFDHVPGLAVQGYGPDLIVTYWNAGSERLYGFTAQEALGRSMLDLVVPPHMHAAFQATVQHMIQTRTPVLSGVQWLQRKDGSPVEVHCNEVFMEHPERGTECFCVDFDLTERRAAEDQRLALEMQLRESQKLEALGTLAGGVAHDFNNIMAAILGNARLALEDVQDNDPAAISLQEILKAGSRARDLVQRILSFSRRQVLQRRVIALGAVVDESVRLLRATLPRTFELQVVCDPRTPTVLADPTQMQQVLLNLCTNAWQAVPDLASGRLQIELKPHRGAPPQPRLAGAAPDAPADWPEVNVCLTVSDNGAGMDAQTLARLFEPFFTTKPPGEGTGLGLAVVHGILRDHQAAIQVDSAPGRGTTFSLYFRAAGQLDAQPDPPEDQHRPAPAQLGEGLAGTRILYVDDDELINHLIGRMLRRSGFQALVYQDPRQALIDVREGTACYDLAITDFAMPGMSGLELAHELRALHPERPVAITSGFIPEELRRLAPAAGIADLIPKPNTCEELYSAIERLASRVCRSPLP
ncbi:MAG: ATP-binding protein [Hydrogenophaga sp.]|uniref:hybrid sensor histidine kinase/response regulator n=1 Tax=Hydrogenophaga sp. TaxID=1904254 RepID=UPI00260E42CF|nr:PAS domain-containing sensor histidine kinase [Hydrogenophaga sp.]MDM7942197.1 ATP-binding protein [Hydrogenophaga sp.]